MEEHYPMLLSRRKAMSFVGKGRRSLENFIQKNNVRFFQTKGGHKRYFKSDLEKAKQNEKL